MLRARLAAAFVSILLLALGGRVSAAADFDFYVLSLSWSPSWCASDAGRPNDAQCRQGMRFIAHGLWPQNERGWPRDCASDEPDRVPSSMMRELGDVMPSIGLVGHEWRTHGVCSGLGQAAYFRLLKQAYGNIHIPPSIFDGAIPRKIAVDDIEKRFMAANPGLNANGVAVTCDDGALSEIRICMTKSLQYRACAEVDRNSCRQRIISIPAAH
jgi:ribonuclease T2